MNQGPLDFLQLFILSFILDSRNLVRHFGLVSPIFNFSSYLGEVDFQVLFKNNYLLTIVPKSLDRFHSKLMRRITQLLLNQFKYYAVVY
ncbi:hypothetical protein QTP88_006822 [Uroleucon formosanum]